MASQVTGQIRTTVAGNIRAARLAADLTQRRLAEAMGVDQMLVSKWERGLHSPSEENFAALAEALRRDRAWFYMDHTTARAA